MPNDHSPPDSFSRHQANPWNNQPDAIAANGQSGSARERSHGELTRREPPTGSLRASRAATDRLQPLCREWEEQRIDSLGGGIKLLRSPRWGARIDKLSTLSRKSGAPVNAAKHSLVRVGAGRLRQRVGQVNQFLPRGRTGVRCLLWTTPSAWWVGRGLLATAPPRRLLFFPGMNRLLWRYAGGRCLDALPFGMQQRM